MPPGVLFAVAKRPAEEVDSAGVVGVLFDLERHPDMGIIARPELLSAYSRELGADAFVISGGHR
jgi:hypothetical protein